MGTTVVTVVPSSLRLYVLIAAALALVAALGIADRRGYNRATLQHEAAQAEVERAYIARLQQRIRDNATLTARYREAREHADTDYQQALAEIDRQRRRADQLGRLRDPGRPATCRPALSAAAGPAGSAADDPAGNELSAAAAGFLFDLAADADRAAAYAQTCHRWVMQTRP
jgi:hypothetical protein